MSVETTRASMGAPSPNGEPIGKNDGLDDPDAGLSVVLVDSVQAMEAVAAALPEYPVYTLDTVLDFDSNELLSTVADHNVLIALPLRATKSARQRAKDCRAQIERLANTVRVGLHPGRELLFPRGLDTQGSRWLWLLNLPELPKPRRKPHTNGKAPPSAVGPAPSGNGRVPAVATQAPRPTIEVNHERHRILAETLDALPRDADVYCRGYMLVRVVREQEDIAKLAGGVTLHNAAGMARVVSLDESALSCRLTALADFVTWRKDRNGEDYSEPTTPPAIIVRAILSHAEYPGVRPLRAIASAPFPRPDGSLVTTPGYDADTGVFLAPGVTLAPIPDKPTQADAKAAAGRLLAVVEQFPFASEDDRVVWLAALVGAVARPGIPGPVPGTAVVANLAGTGKGTLINSIGIIATGHPIPTTSYPYDKIEAAKIKASLALAATEIVHLDNIDAGHQYGNGGLDSALTSLTVNERILGQSKQTGSIELRPSWLLSGNNITPAKDAGRRWLVCNLVTDLERPNERGDLKITNLLGYMAEHRAELLRDVLVILQAHAAAGRPTGDWAPLGSFEEWDGVVRAAVWYATGRDCNTTRRKAAEDAPDRLARVALLDAWQVMPGCSPTGRGMTALEACRLANLPENADLADVLLAFSKDGSPPSQGTIGNVIRAIAGCNIRGKLFQKAGEYKGSALWRVQIDGTFSTGADKRGQFH